MNRRQKPRQRPDYRLAYRINDAAYVCGLSRTVLYKEIRAGKLGTVKRNRTTLVLHDELEDYLSKLPATIH